MIFKIGHLIRDLFKRKPRPAAGPPAPAWLDKYLGRKIKRREAQLAEMGRPIDTSRGGPNMPKYQPCPRGHGWKRRKYKTLNGAAYYCNQCKTTFLVRAK